ncbi:hypothetical protein Q5424_01005 [Conexibacter sp. JD483]|uniref:hypothetical protein n=1 Tax=unclassified Conexibacter TaxID=2627773 RepID=UPI00271D2F53|nr:MULTISPECIES: hypothetical protein [unclassified Conexibacter]MDO8185806.1 hypothetical protein [Conexibacter sp. CPCC 205706]MDO8198550.1 hypothetical protein [Conexibacter sp. CPCC 205762]MDR9367636.1 hypothetical protein [Conexibacter sp. JD483]
MQRRNHAGQHDHNKPGADTRPPKRRSNGFLRRLTGGVAVALIASAGAAPSASAAGGAFTQVLCSDPVTTRGVGGGLPVEIEIAHNNSRWNLANSISSCPQRYPLSNEGIGISASAGSYAVGTYTTIHYAVPAGLELRAGTIYRALWNYAPNNGYLAINQNAGSEPSNIWAEPAHLTERGDWFAGNVTRRGVTTSSFPAENRVDLKVAPKAGWTITAACVANATTCDWGTNRAWEYRIYGGRMSLFDTSDATVTNVSGSLATETVLRGTEGVAFTATDVGSGIYRAVLEVDGNVIERKVIDTNAGRCATLSSTDDYVFSSAVPCKLSVGSGNVTFDTTKAPEGIHAIRVLVEDASGNQTTALNRRAEIDNLQPPTHSARPTTAGTPTVGAELTSSSGTWAGAPTPSLTLQWLRCPATATEESDLATCVPIQGATTSTYTPIAADAYHRLTLKVTGTNSQGTLAAFSTPTKIVADQDGITDPTPRSTRSPDWTTDSPIAAPRPGDRLTALPGTWVGPAVNTSTRFLRCATAGGGCEPIASGASATYTVTAADVGKHLIAEVSAANAFGTASARTPATGAIAAANDATGRDTGTERRPVGDDGTRNPDTANPLGPSGRSPSTPSFDILGLTNPIAGPGHASNGTGASENARGRALFEIGTGKARRQVATVTGRFAQRQVVRGRLVNASGKAIGGAKLVTAWQLPGGRWVAKTGVVTTKAGMFVYILPKGPSRRIRFVYFAFADSRTYSSSNTITANTRAVVSLRVAPRAARNGNKVRFTGTVGRQGLPKSGVLVTLRARYPGGQWKKFNVVRTDRTGHYTATYRFTSTTVTTRYEFVAEVSRQGLYPFVTGSSRRTTVTVRPSGP